VESPLNHSGKFLRKAVDVLYSKGKRLVRDSSSFSNNEIMAFL